MYCIQSINNRPVLSRTDQKFSSKNIWIQVMYAGLCRTDVLAAKGILSVPQHRILGHECAGLVTYAPPESHLSVGMFVTVHPLHSTGFLGIDMNGAFAEHMEVPESMVYPLPSGLSLQQAAFTEPVAAALAILDCGLDPQDRGLILGTGRIAALTYDILKLHGFHHLRCSESIREGTFDFIIETNIHHHEPDLLLHALRSKGILILKSRMHTNIRFSTQTVVEKQLRIQGAYYGSFERAIQLIHEQKIDCTKFFGNVYSMHDFVLHFDDQEEHKIFCTPTEIGTPCVES